MVTVVKGTALLVLLVMATLFFLHDPYESRAIFILFSVLNTLGVLTARRLAWGLIRALARHIPEEDWRMRAANRAGIPALTAFNANTTLAFLASRSIRMK